MNKALNFLVFSMINIYNRKIPVLPKLLQVIIRIIFSADIPKTAKIGEGTKFIHSGLGVVIHSDAIIGKDCKIYHNVTIGGRHNRGCPQIGNNVFIGAGACVLGGVSIGDNAMIGANAVVINDVSEGSVVGGIPAKQLKA